MSAHASVTRGPLAVFAALALLAACAHGGSDTPDAAGAERGPDEGAQLTGDDIQNSPSVPIEQLLAGRVAGVWVTRAANGSIAVRIRGTSTINGSTQPLYVLDGVAIRPGPGGALVGIQPSEIESIEVLKDAASTAMYGTRGANGVILIKLKRPD